MIRSYPRLLTEEQRNGLNIDVTGMIDSMDLKDEVWSALDRMEDEEFLRYAMENCDREEKLEKLKEAGIDGIEKILAIIMLDAEES